MAPLLSDRSINTRGPHLGTPTVPDLHNLTPQRRDENSFPLNFSGKIPVKGRVQPKQSVPRLPVASHCPYTPMLSASKLPKRAETPNSAKSLSSSKRLAPTLRGVMAPGSASIVDQPSSIVTIHSHIPEKKPRSVNKPLPMEKALPPRPIATFVNTMSPSKDGRSIMDAAEQPLRLSPGTSNEADWPTLSPLRQSALAATAISSSDFTSLAEFVPPPHASPITRTLCSYHPDPNLRSHWSADTPETPTSLVPPAQFRQSFNSTDSSFATRSPTMIDLQSQDAGPESMSVIDSTSDGALTISTVDTTELVSKFTGITQEPQDHETSPKNISVRRSIPKPGFASRSSVLPATPTPQPGMPLPHRTSKHQTTASRIPIFDPRKTPNIVEIKAPIIPVPSVPTSDGPIFGGRRLDTPADLAALDQAPRASARRQSSSGGIRQPGSAQITLATKVSLSSVRGHQVRRLTPSPVPTDLLPRQTQRLQHKASSTSTGSFSSGRVRKLSGQLLSSSFLGSTLTIHDDADALIMGSGQGRLTDQDAAFDGSRPIPYGDELTIRKVVDREQETDHRKPQPKPDVSPLDIEPHGGVTGPDHHDLEAQHDLSTDVAGLPGTNDGFLCYGPRTGTKLPARDGESEGEITTTLSLLEGTSPPAMPTQESFLAFASQYNERLRQRVEQTHDYFHGSKKQDSAASEAISPQMIRQTTSAAQQNTNYPSVVKPETSYQAISSSSIPRPMPDQPSECMPSYMNSTPASQARRASKVQNKDGTISAPAPRLPYKASRVLGATEGELDGSGKSSRSRKALSMTKTPGYTALAKSIDHCGPDMHLSEQENEISTRISPAGLSDCRHAGSHATAFSSGTTTPLQPVTKDKTRRRSESKGRLFSNFKGLFSAKREIGTPPIPSTDSKRLNNKSRKTTLNVHGNPDHGRSLVTVDEGVLPDAQIGAAPGGVQCQPIETASVINPAPPGQWLAHKTKDLVAVMNVTQALIAEASNETDMTKKERLVSFAKVLMDTISHSREAERSMIVAQQAADTATVSCQLAQQSVAELAFMLAHPRGGITGVLRKIATKAGH